MPKHHPALEKIQSFIKHLGLADSSGSEVVVAVSGGVDSMVLLHSLVLLGYPVRRILYFVHGIRPDETDSQVLVEQQAKLLGLDVIEISLKEKLNAQADGSLPSNFEAKAHHLRKSAYQELHHSCGALVALGHHQDDLLETGILHLLRGQGLRGEAAFLAKDQHIIRPLLAIDKALVIELADYLAHRTGLLWHEDATNNNLDIKRNWVRHEIIPKLITQNPSLASTYARSVQKTQAALQALDAAQAYWGSLVGFQTIHASDAHIAAFEMRDFSGHQAMSSGEENYHRQMLKQRLMTIYDLTGQVFEIHWIDSLLNDFIFNPTRKRYKLQLHQKLPVTLVRVDGKIHAQFEIALP